MRLISINPLFQLLVIALFLICVTPKAAQGQVPESEISQEHQEQLNDEESIWQMRRWSPYAVGFGIGVLCWLAFLFSDKPLGVSTAFARTSGLLEKSVRGKSAVEKEYYREYEPKIDWEWMLVVGLVIGAFLSATISGSFRWEVVPPLWRQAFGQQPVVRWLVALVGGFFIGLGARWANGCTSGHGISGTLQLTVSSWIAVTCFFVGGVITAFILY